MDFDPAKSFDENLAAFRQELEAIDAQAASILFEKLDLLTAAGARDRNATAKFNAAVKAVLDRLIPSEVASGDAG